MSAPYTVSSVKSRDATFVEARLISVYSYRRLHWFMEDIMTVIKLAAHSSRRSRTVGSPVDAIVSKYVDHLRALRYADDTIQHYLASLRHFTRRLNKRLTIVDIHRCSRDGFCRCSFAA